MEDYSRVKKLENLPIINNPEIAKKCTEYYTNKSINKYYAQNVSAIVAILFIIIILLFIYRD